MNALTVQGLSVHYGRTCALQDVSFEVAPGELVGVIGPNGAGKSSMFGAICGQLRHQGTVALGDRHCHHHRERMGIGFIPQRSRIDLDFPISVGQLVAMGRRRFTGPIARLRARDRLAVNEALDTVHLGDLIDRPIGTLSGGQLQRAFVARALAQEADVLLLDEALSGVDAPSTEELFDVFTTLTTKGCSLLVATHDLALARRRFPRCLAINGRLVADGPPEAALSTEAVDATFGSARLVVV